MKQLFRTVLLLSLGWNIFLVIGVIANQSYALTRAAGGQFNSFPIGIRLAYVVTLAILIYQFLILQAGLAAPRWVLTAMLAMGVLSVIVNTISQSANERWNAIPAVIIAIAIFQKWKIL